MRVLYVSHSSGLGGERALLSLIAQFEEGVVEPIVALPGPGPLEQELHSLGVQTLVTPLAWWIPATHWSREDFVRQLEGIEGRCAAMTEIVESLRPDVVHTNALVTLEGAVAAGRLGTPHVLHSRGLFGGGFPPPYLDDVPFFYGVLDALSNVIVCISAAVERQVAAHCPTARRVIVYDGFDPSSLFRQPQESREDLFAALGLEPRRRLVLCLGGLQRRKAQGDLLLALERLRGDFPELVVVLAGTEADPEYVRKLHDLVCSYALEDHVRFAGFRSEIRPLLEHAEMLVHPSHSEGFALAVLEAVALGTPVVATRSGGPEEIIEEGVSGLLVDPGDPEALAEAMRAVLTRPDLAQRLRREGPLRATRFGAATGSRQLESIYQALVAGSSAVAPARRLAAERAGAEILQRAARSRARWGDLPKYQGGSW